MAQDGQRRRGAGGSQPQVSEALPPAIADALFGRGAGFTAYQQATGMGAGMSTALPPAVAAAAVEPVAPASTGQAATRDRRASLNPPAPPPERGPRSARRDARRQDANTSPQPTPLAQTRGTPFTQVALPPTSMEQVRANAAATLGQLNVAQIAALQGIIPERPEPIPVEDQILQTALDGITQAYQFSQRDGASVEEAAAGQTAFMEQLFALAGRDMLGGFGE